MQHNKIITAHKLAEILLRGEDFPVVIPSQNKKSNAELIHNVFVLQNHESPFEYAILLEGSSNLEIDGLVNVLD